MLVRLCNGPFRPYYLRQNVEKPQGRRPYRCDIIISVDSRGIGKGRNTKLSRTWLSLSHIVIPMFHQNRDGLCQRTRFWRSWLTGERARGPALCLSAQLLATPPKPIGPNFYGLLWSTSLSVLRWYLSSVFVSKNFGVCGLPVYICHCSPHRHGSSSGRPGSLLLWILRCSSCFRMAGGGTF